MDIDYGGSLLLFINMDDLICYSRENQQTEQRRNQYYLVKDQIDKVVEYVLMYERTPPMEAESVKEYHRIAAFEYGFSTKQLIRKMYTLGIVVYNNDETVQV